MNILDAAQQQSWQEQGYLVVPDVVPTPLLEAVIETIEAFLGKDLSDPDDWYREPMYSGGIINMNHHQSMWETRQYPRVHAVFSEIWGTEKLSVSQDRTNMNPPTGPLWDNQGTIHWDMDSTEQPLPMRVQGVLCLTDTNADQGGFQCVPRFHRQLEAWAATQPEDRPPSRPDTTGMDIVDVPAAAGDLIIWNSALPHGNSCNRTDRPRLCQYITMSPAPVAHDGSPLPLQRTRRAAVADALGVAEGLVEQWHRLQREADRVVVVADRIGPYPPIPDLIRIEKGDQVRYCHPAWGECTDDRTMIVTREHAERLELPIRGPSPESADQILAAMARIPAPSRDAQLNEGQLRTLASLLTAGPSANGFAGRFWDEESTACVLERVFDLQLSTKEAELSGLGRKLAGVDAW